MRKERRSASQILFGFLPDQTVDLEGKVWRVRRWINPVRQSNIDTDTLRRELARHAAAWAPSMDGGFVEKLRRRWEIRVYSLDRKNGVEVELFPQVWRCKRCHRVLPKLESNCRCGHRGAPGQLHFVGYHDACGALREPWIPRCPTHDDVRIVFPGTSSASEILFQCPECLKTLRKGFGFPKCGCGEGQLTFNVHRSSFVYTPRSIVIVNPPSLEKIRRITQAGGPARALEWVLGGMGPRHVDEVPPSRESLRQQLVDSGFANEVVEAMLQSARESGALTEGTQVRLEERARSAAETEAITLALATSESRLTIDDMIDGTGSGTQLGDLYMAEYEDALRNAGLETVELIDNFPVLTGQFGFTRGNPTPGASRLVPFTERNGDYVVYGDIAATEALLVKLDPLLVARWLTKNGWAIEESNSRGEARANILRTAVIPAFDSEGNPAGTRLLTLVHSFAHRLIRLGAVHAGIDQNALSEVLVPLHLSFIVYASARGDFVMGGLQAVFEAELHTLLQSVARESTRCPLDPGCLNAAGACMACLHLGEPSCRLYNLHLDRRTLFGDAGFLTMAMSHSPPTRARQVASGRR